jgi:hypothetical protein
MRLCSIDRFGEHDNAFYARKGSWQFSERSNQSFAYSDAHHAIALPLSIRSVHGGDEIGCVRSRSRQCQRTTEAKRSWRRVPRIGLPPSMRPSSNILQSHNGIPIRTGRRSAMSDNEVMYGQFEQLDVCGRQLS